MFDVNFMINNAVTRKAPILAISEPASPMRGRRKTIPRTYSTQGGNSISMFLA
jgi:hypothetical protein